LEIKLGTKIPDAVALAQYQAGIFLFELPRKRTFRLHLNTPSPVVGYHPKACPKSVDHYTLQRLYTGEKFGKQLLRL
jgi:hypothetical protein